MKEPLVWKEIFICPYCDFSTWKEDLFLEHLKVCLRRKKDSKDFNPSERQV